MNPLLRAYWFNPQVGLLRQIEAMIINRSLVLAPNGPSIDIGCGSGRFALALSRRIDEGLDEDPARIPQVERLGIYQSVRCGNIEDLGRLQADHYALIIANSVLEHTERPEACLASMHQALRPDGMLYLTVITAKSRSYGQLAFLPEDLRGAFTSRFNRYFQHRQLLEAETWTELCSLSGLRVEEMTRYLLPETQRVIDAFNPYQTRTNAKLTLEPAEEDACADLLAEVWESLFAPHLECESRALGHREDGSCLFLRCTRKQS
jgi:2-polyprenyl-3-methyl-5-hydroxy-6-metoxy-1,4-benzoquinol methylase